MHRGKVFVSIMSTAYVIFTAKFILIAITKYSTPITRTFLPVGQRNKHTSDNTVHFTDVISSITAGPQNGRCTPSRALRSLIMHLQRTKVHRLLSPTRSMSEIVRFGECKFSDD